MTSTAAVVTLAYAQTTAQTGHFGPLNFHGRCEIGEAGNCAGIPWPIGFNPELTTSGCQTSIAARRTRYKSAGLVDTSLSKYYIIYYTKAIIGISDGSMVAIYLHNTYKGHRHCHQLPRPGVDDPSRNVAIHISIRKQRLLWTFRLIRAIQLKIF
jgi:hypothetical protein